jgi:hypothetical protein
MADRAVADQKVFVKLSSVTRLHKQLIAAEEVVAKYRSENNTLLAGAMQYRNGLKQAIELLELPLTY